VWPDKKLGADGHCDVEPGSAAADREKSGIVRRRRDNNLEKRRSHQGYLGSFSPELVFVT
ncbi:hypothetical protein, partial [Pseudomonas sp. RA_15y_Pfl2_54]|uniref:hypothetical protein n=1 Tax=Pseudomonas sp. RA_15y_Pfl2_54 TaxID=3088704 RepID=UPI0030D7AEBE